MDALTVECVTKLSRVLCISVENQIPLAAKESVFGIGDITRNLGHPAIVRVRCDAGDVHRPRCDVDEEQEVIRDQSLERVYLDAQEIGCRQTFPVGFKKRRPSRVSISLGGGSMPCSWRMLAMVPRPTSCPRLASAPRMRVYPHERFSSAMRRMRSTIVFIVRGRAWSAPSAVIPFLCHQLAVPAQQGARCDQRVQPVQRFATKYVRFSRESSTFGIGEANALSAQAFLEQAVLFLEVADHIQLMTVDPPSEHHQ